MTNKLVRCNWNGQIDTHDNIGVGGFLRLLFDVYFGVYTFLLMEGICLVDG